MSFMIAFVVCLITGASAKTSEIIERSSQACGKTDNYSPSGEISSPNYPNNYTSDLYCYYYIHASTGSSLCLFFNSFNTQRCCDIVTISCPNNSSFPPRQFSGDSLPGPVLIPWCSLGIVYLRTDASVDAKGFSLKYYASTGVCGTSAFFGSTGLISSPNHPNNYDVFLNCDYYVHASTGSSLSFFFKSFKTENYYDFVTISCPGNSSVPLQQFSGDVFPGPVSIPSCSRGLVHFHTDGSIVTTGFNLEYYVSQGGCGNTVFNGTNGFVTSPNYPGNYGNNQNCSNIIWAPQLSTFYLSFKSFKLQSCCKCDWLEISCLDSSEHSTTRYCGNDDSNDLYIHACSQVLLWFHSDGSKNQRGFNIEYSVNPEAADESKVPSHGKLNAEGAPNQGKPSSI